MTRTMDRSDSNEQQFDDTSKVARLKAGDMSACKACVEEHWDGLYPLAFRLLRAEAAAEDIVQETFLNAFKSLEEAIAAIPETLSVVFQLRGVEERSTAETAQILGLTEGTVKDALRQSISFRDAAD